MASIRRGAGAGVILVILAAMAAGCGETQRRVQVKSERHNALFGHQASERVATMIGRADWPSTAGNYETQQDTIFVEYYRDSYSGAQNERITPYRSFQSYRIGATQR